MQGLGEAWGWGRRGQMRQKSPCQAQTLPGLELGLIILLPGQQRRALPQRTRCGPRGRRGERGSRRRGNGGHGEGACVDQARHTVTGLAFCPCSLGTGEAFGASRPARKGAEALKPVAAERPASDAGASPLRTPAARAWPTSALARPPRAELRRTPPAPRRPVPASSHGNPSRDTRPGTFIFFNYRERVTPPSIKPCPSEHSYHRGHYFKCLNFLL